MDRVFLLDLLSMRFKYKKRQHLTLQSARCYLIRGVIKTIKNTTPPQ